MDTRHRKKTHTPPKKIDTGNIGHKTQKDRHGPHQKKIDTGNIEHKTQKDRHQYH